MMRKLALLILFAAPAVCAQNYGYAHDAWGGNTAQTCPSWPPASTRIAITGIVQSSGTVTITVGSTANVITTQGYVTGVTDSFYNTSTSGTGQAVTVANGTTLTYAIAGNHAASSGGYFVPDNWYTQLVGNAQYLCTPLGNRLFVEAITAGTITTAAKYGTAAQTGTAIINEFTSWNFNAFGDQFFGVWTPVGGSCSGGCPALPLFNSCVCDEYATGNLGGYGSQATIDLDWGLDSNYMGVANAIMLDSFAPYFQTYLNGFMTNFASIQAYRTSPWMMFQTIGSPDSDLARALGAGPDFDTVVGGKNNQDVSYTPFVTAPLQTVTPSSDYGSLVEIYADPLVYSKARSSAPASCSIATPCSVYEMLQKKYGTVGAMNTALGSSYGTLGSSGTGLGYAYSWLANTGAAIAVGTGNAATLTFTVATHANVEPYSVQILLAGAAIGGDCPAFNGGCTASAGQGAIIGTNLSGGTITYTTGSLTVTFAGGHAPGNGVAVTANLIYGGWDSGGTGAMDEDGGIFNGYASNVYCLLPVAGGGPGTTSYSCRTGNGNGLPVPNFNAVLAALLVGYDPQVFGELFKVSRTAEKAGMPLVLYAGIDTSGAWCAPPPLGALQAEAVYVDIHITQTCGLVPSITISNAEWSYTTQYLGNLPILNIAYMTACLDSTLGGSNPSCGGVWNLPSQLQRAAALDAITRQLLKNTGFNGVLQGIGYSHWSLNDADTDGGTNNWGLKSGGNGDAYDNAYDAHEPAAGSVACSAPLAAFTCGSEPAPSGSAVRPFGDYIDGVKALNTYWFAGFPGSSAASGSKIALGVSVQ